MICVLHIHGKEAHGKEVKKNPTDVSNVIMNVLLL